MTDHATEPATEPQLTPDPDPDPVPDPTGAVVVGHDGSSNSDRALETAIRYAVAFGAPLIVVRTWALDAHAPAFTRIMSGASSFRDISASVRTALVTSCEPFMRDYPGLSVTYRVELGAAADALTHAAAKARVLVVGSRGLGGVSGLLLGSVSDRCLHEARCPVLIVHEPGSPKRTQRRLDEEERVALPQPGNELVVVGHDGSADSDRALELAFDYAVTVNRGLAVIRCWTIDRMPQGLLWHDGHVISFTEASETIREQLIADVADISGRYPEVDVTFFGLLGDPGDTLVQVSQDAALLVVGSRGRGGFASLLVGSVSAHCAHRATCPTLIVPHPRRGAENPQGGRA